jgi:hypothetical protein
LTCGQQGQQGSRAAKWAAGQKSRRPTRLHKSALHKIKIHGYHIHRDRYWLNEEIRVIGSEQQLNFLFFETPFFTLNKN